MTRTDFRDLVRRAVSASGYGGGSERVIEKEILHYDILHALFRSGLLAGLVFHGGTALRFCHGGERLSEDLDFCAGDGFQAEKAVALATAVRRAVCFRSVRTEGPDQRAERACARRCSRPALVDPGGDRARTLRCAVAADQTGSRRRAFANERTAFACAELRRHSRRVRGQCGQGRDQGGNSRGQARRFSGGVTNVCTVAGHLGCALASQSAGWRRCHSGQDKSAGLPYRRLRPATRRSCRASAWACPFPGAWRETGKLRASGLGCSDCPEPSVAGCHCDRIP